MLKFMGAGGAPLGGVRQVFGRKTGGAAPGTSARNISGLLLNASMLAGCERAGLVAHFVVTWVHFVWGLGGGGCASGCAGLGYALAGRQIIDKGGCVGGCARHFRACVDNHFHLTMGGAAAEPPLEKNCSNLGGCARGLRQRSRRTKNIKSGDCLHHFGAMCNVFLYCFVSDFIGSAWGGCGKGCAVYIYIVFQSFFRTCSRVSL